MLQSVRKELVVDLLDRKADRDAPLHRERDRQPDGRVGYKEKKTRIDVSFDIQVVRDDPGTGGRDVWACIEV